MVYFLVHELYEAWIGSGKIKMVEMVGGEKLMKYKTGLQLAHGQQLMLSGIMVPKICIELDLKEWLVL